MILTLLLVYPIITGYHFEEEYIKKLAIGQTYQEIVDMMGNPTLSIYMPPPKPDSIMPSNIIDKKKIDCPQIAIYGTKKSKGPFLFIREIGIYFKTLRLSFDVNCKLVNMKWHIDRTQKRRKIANYAQHMKIFRPH